MHPVPQISTDPSKFRANPALERLHEGVRELLDSEAWRAALKFKARFTHYSFNNTMLIYLQRPDASLVAGYRRWQELGRQVNKGERSLMILAPIVRKDEQKERQVIGFRTARVFDVSQTDGEPIPMPPQPVLLEADSPEIGDLLSRAEALAVTRGYRVEMRELGAALGRYSRLDKTILLRSDLPTLQRLKTLIHELAHALMHGKKQEGEKRHVLELEAESCAFLVLEGLGLDSSCYSFPYLASWTEQPDELLVAGEKATKVSASILGELKPQES